MNLSLLYAVGFLTVSMTSSFVTSSATGTIAYWNNIHIESQDKSCVCMMKHLWDLNIDTLAKAHTGTRTH